MIGLNGGLLGAQRVPTTVNASGLWVPNEQSLAKRAAIWPTTGDPYFNSVSLLLHMDGNNEGIVFTDDSNNTFNVVATGATTSSVQAKFGPTAMVCGSTQRLDISANEKFVFPGDFTIELWVWKSSTQPAAYKRFFELASYQNGILLGLDGVFVSLGSPNIGAIPLVDNTWCHYALTRSGTTLRSFVDGVQHGSSATVFGSIPTTSTAAIRIGQASHVSGQYLNGYIDDLRITKGIARYTANFTPPAAAFPNV